MAVAAPSAIKRALFSNTDWSLIHSCSAPLLLVKPRQFATAPRILAAVDPLHAHAKPAELDHAILALATELATVPSILPLMPARQSIK